LHGHRWCVHHPAGDPALEQRQPRRPTRGLLQALGEVAAPDQVLELDDLAGQLAHRQPEDAAGTERGEIRLHAGGLPRVLGERRRVVQAAGERGERAAVDVHARAERDDEHDPAAGQL
jgi:hypothetical protein